MMITWWSMLALAIAVSLDGFGAGMMYGVRKIRIPPASVAVVSFISAFVLFGSMAAGEVLASALPETAAKWVGAAILIGIGVWAIVQMALTSRNESQADRDSGKDSDAEGTGGTEDAASAEGGSGAGDVAAAAVVAGSVPSTAIAAAAHEQPSAAAKAPVLLWEFRRLGLIIRIWRTPSMADVDRSGVISASEAVLLGVALSLDSLGAGIGAALLGFPPALTSLVIGAACGLCIAAGVRFGFLLSGWRWVNKLTVVPGCILIIMGLLKLF